MTDNKDIFISTSAYLTTQLILPKYNDALLIYGCEDNLFSTQHLSKDSPYTCLLKPTTVLHAF